MRYRITHVTQYSYTKIVSYCYNLAHLLPRNSERQVCNNSFIDVSPPAANLVEHNDFFGNRAVYFNVQTPHDALTVTAVSEVEVMPNGNLLNFAFPVPWNEVRNILMASSKPEDIDARQYLLESPFVSVDDGIVSYAQASFVPGRPVLEAVHELMDRIHNDFDYDQGFTTIATPLSDVLAHRKGVCQDFAHLAIACLIAYGIPARYVSGYLETIPPPGQARMRGADASHAWFSVYVPDLGWVDFDPTNNQIPMDRHITTAWGRDYGDVTPLKGVIFGGDREHKLSVSVDVESLESVTS